MMEGIHHRCRNRIACWLALYAAPAIIRLCDLSAISPRPNGFLLCKSLSRHDDIHHRTAAVIALLLCRFSPFWQSDIAAFRLSPKLRFALRRPWTLPAKASHKRIPHLI
jgi:hypothetical protein